MDDVNIQESLYNIFINRYDKFNVNLETLFQKELFGGYFNLSPGQLLYLFVDIERYFNIIIQEDEIIYDNFKNLEAISNLIGYKMKRG